MNKKLAYFAFVKEPKRHKEIDKGNSVEPFVYRGLRGVPRARTQEGKSVVFTSALLEREREREREKRVANYLELPNNPTTFLQENRNFLALPICRYVGRMAWKACMSLSFSTYVLFKICGQRYGIFLI